MIADLRVLALEDARELERRANRYPKGEPGRQWLRAMATRLKNSYARTRAQQKQQIMVAIYEGSRQISDFVDELGFSRREVASMLRELIADRLVLELTAPADGKGRPPQWFGLTESAETKLADFFTAKKNDF